MLASPLGLPPDVLAVKTSFSSTFSNSLTGFISLSGGLKVMFFKLKEGMSDAIPLLEDGTSDKC